MFESDYVNSLATSQLCVRLVKMMKKIVLVFLSLLMIQSCTTISVWDEYNPSKYLQIEGSADVVDPFLKSTDQDYYCNDLYYPTPSRDRVCYVEKTAKQKGDDFIGKLYETPKAVAIDAVTTIAVIGYIVVVTMALASSCQTSPKGEVCRN